MAPARGQRLLWRHHYVRVAEEHSGAQLQLPEAGAERGLGAKLRSATWHLATALSAVSPAQPELEQRRILNIAQLEARYQPVSRAALKREAHQLGQPGQRAGHHGT